MVGAKQIGGAARRRLCTPLAGGATGAVLLELDRYDLKRLRADLEAALHDWDWDAGSFGHSLPLTSERLTDFGRRHHNNQVTAGSNGKHEAPDRLNRCPYFLEIFESMRCEKSSFRILRRPAFTSYTLHRDNDIGEHTHRLQIPIRSGPGTRFLITDVDDRNDFVVGDRDLRKVEDWAAAGLSEAAMAEWLDEFVSRNANRVRLYAMEEGRLYWFHDPRRYHNLYNFDSETRYTLAMDLVENDWLCAAYPELRQHAA